MTEGKMQMNDGADKVAMVWPEQQQQQQDQPHQQQEKMMIIEDTNINDHSNINNNNSEGCQPTTAGAPAPVQTAGWLKGDNLYTALLLLLRSWGVENTTIATVFDRMEAHVLVPNIGTFEMLSTVRQHRVVEDEMIVYALALMRKLIIMTGLPITHRNYNHVFFACLSLANKAMSDNPFGVACFDQIARVSKGCFAKYEKILLITFAWSVDVTDAELQQAHDMLL